MGVFHSPGGHVGWLADSFAAALVDLVFLIPGLAFLLSELEHGSTGNLRM